MDSLSIYDKIVLIKEFDLNYDVQSYLNKLDVNDILYLIKKYKIDYDITPLIGKTDSNILLEKAVESNNVELVKQCLYCQCNDNDTWYISYTAFKNGNSEIINLLLDKIKFKYDCSDDICELNHDVVIKYFDMYKDKFENTKIFKNICHYSKDETFLYFYEQIKDEADCFQSCIESGKLDRVKMMIHLYGKPTKFDIEYKRKFNLNSIENYYISTACKTGNLELIKYLLSIRITPCEMNNECINLSYVCESGNLELIQYLHNLGYIIDKKDYFEIYRYSLPIFEWLLQQGVGPLTYSLNDDGSKNYDFYNLIIHKKIEYLKILQKYCNEKELKKVMKCILSNWDDIFIPLLTDTRFFPYCESIHMIEYHITLGDISEKQWAELFYNLIPTIEKSECRQIFNTYKDKINLSLLVSKIGEKRNYWSKNIKNIIIELIL